MMKLARQFLVVLLVIAGFVAIGYAWKASPAASLVANQRGDRQPADGSFSPRDRGGKGNHGLSVSNVGDLIQSMAIMALVVTGVVVIDVARRQRRRTELAL